MQVDVRSPYSLPPPPPVVGVVAPPPCVDAFEASFVEPVVSWRKAVLAGLSVLGAVGGMVPLSAPPPPTSLAVASPSLDFPKMSPYVASMAGEVWAGMQGEITDQVVFLPMPRHFGSNVRVGLGLQNGPHAPMLVILPGIGGNSYDAKVNVLKRMALSHGMNYTVLANPLSTTWQYSHPRHDPGNPAWEAEVVYDTLRAMQTRMPSYYERVSMVGYSYGGLLGASVLRHQAGRAPIVTGGFAAVSPPQHLMDSMRQLDSLRHSYEGREVGSYLLETLAYRGDIQRHGFEGFAASERGRRTDDTLERRLADRFGSRFNFQDMVSFVDRARGYNFLPLNRREAERRWPVEDHAALRDAQYDITMKMTWQDYADKYLSRDPWFKSHGLTPQALADQYRYTTLIASAGVPTMTLVSADDFVLTEANVAEFRASTRVQVVEHGGHGGLFFSPSVREHLAEFLRKQ